MKPNNHFRYYGLRQILALPWWVSVETILDLRCVAKDLHDAYMNMVKSGYRAGESIEFPCYRRVDMAMLAKTNLTKWSQDFLSKESANDLVVEDNVCKDATPMGLEQRSNGELLETLLACRNNCLSTGQANFDNEQQFSDNSQHTLARSQAIHAVLRPILFFRNLNLYTFLATLTLFTAHCYTVGMWSLLCLFASSYTSRLFIEGVFDCMQMDQQTRSQGFFASIKAFFSAFMPALHGQQAPALMGFSGRLTVPGLHLNGSLSWWIMGFDLAVVGLLTLSFSSFTQLAALPHLLQCALGMKVMGVRMWVPLVWRKLFPDPRLATGSDARLSSQPFPANKPVGAAHIHNQQQEPPANPGATLTSSV